MASEEINSCEKVITSASETDLTGASDPPIDAETMRRACVAKLRQLGDHWGANVGTIEMIADRIARMTAAEIRELGDP